MEEILSNFVSKWTLDSQSEAMLRELPEGLLEDVAKTFDPPPDTRNMNAKLKTFVRSKQTGGPRDQAWTTKSAKTSSPSDQIGHFAQTWGLDAGAQQMLKELHPEACAHVLAEFAPPADTQNVNAKLHAFVRGMSKNSGQSGHQVQDPVKGFVGYWGVDAASEALLRGLHPQQLEAVLTEFSPPPGTQNISGKLTSFIRSIGSRNGGSAASQKGYEKGYGKGGYGKGKQQQQQQYQDPVSAFITHFGIDAPAQQALWQLPSNLQEQVLREFNPPPDTMNASGKLTAFIRGKMKELQEGGGVKGGGKKGGGTKRPFSDPVADFVMHWHLDPEAEQLLRGLSWDMQQGIMSNFHPPPDTLNFSGKFHSFVKKSLGGSIPGAAEGAWTSGKGDGKGGLGGNSAPRRPPSSQARSNGDPIANFVQQWGLDGTSDSLLRSLSEDILQQVLANFHPQAGTRNPNAKLATWVRSLSADGAPAAKRPKIA